MVLHLQRPLVPMLFVFGNGMRATPAGSTAEFMVVMNHVSVVYGVKLGLGAVTFAFVVKNRTMESHVVSLPFTGPAGGVYEGLARP